MSWKTPQLKNLIKAFLSIKNETGMENFLRDLCTVAELKELSKRWEVVEMLNKKFSYREIAQKTKISTSTVSRIAFWLKHGKGGYREVLKNLSK